jgi:hypothetical protein
MCLGQLALAQSATKSYPFAVGRVSCSSGTQQIHYYNYNGVTNTIQNAHTGVAGNLANNCVPQLRTGGAANGTQRFTSSLASVSFNPKDHKIYYFWTKYSPTVTYAWSWPVGTCPGTAANKLDTIRSFAADILGVAFDNNGNGYLLDFTTEPNGVPHKGMIRSINFTTGVLGAADTLNLTGGAVIYQTGSGDVAMTPSGQMFFVIDNKLFTPNYTAYTGTGAYLTCTYIDTVKTTNNFVGLTYAEGETIAAYSGGGCPFEEINPLTAAVTAVTKNNVPANVYSTSDFAAIISGIGAAKKLVSVTATGTPNQYDVIYDIVVKNYGNMDVTGVQVKDTLSNINGALNVTNVSVTIPVNPNGYTVNPLYTGVGPLATNYDLLNGTPTLPNYPVSNGSFTIRISCRLSNIISGVIYYNRAAVTATDYNGNSLKDLSTKGSNPDLNANDKPDDVGEDQPTPLLIAVTAQTPPCTSLTKVLFFQDFGSGTGLTTTIPAPVLGSGASGGSSLTTYTGSITQPIPIETYTVTENANNANNTRFINLTDHTGGANGRMLVVNADAAASKLYRGGFTYNMCPSQQYSISFYAAFLGNATYQTVCDGVGGFKYPKILINIIDGTTLTTITQVSTVDITNASWQQYGLKFVSPGTYTSIIFELVNDGPGGCGNDLAIDDIQFGSCDPIPVVNANAVAGCIGGSSVFTGSLSDPSAIPGTKEYQWQVATALAGPYVDIPGATSATYTINPVNPADTGKYYRLAVAALGNMSNVNCRFTSPGILLTGKIPSVAPTSANKNKNNICPGITVGLSITGGTLGTNASWKWYTGSCATTLAGTGSTLNVTPAITTTYYVRAEGDCNNTACQSVTVFVSCNIDKDRDGIPDWVESNMAAAFADANANGIINAYDPTYAGFIDNNNDYINDNFQADGDSDNDGIPNYLDTDFPGRIDTNGDAVDDRFDTDKDGIINMLDLDSDNDGIPDVVEAYGVDTNGDGKIDNFTDTDGDGLSDQFDGNLSPLNGAYNTGLGLSIPDFDGDGIPNYLDLDSDNDGIPDVVETGGPDTNNDGKIDGFVDANGDGLHDGYINGTALLTTGADGNGDGKADTWPNKNLDRDLRPNAYDLDSDADGIVDVIEAGLPDANLNGIVDGVIGVNGWSTTVSVMPALNLRNTDGSGNPDYLDIDSDDDGIPDNIEGMSTAGYLLPGITDTDGDGLVNTYDNIVGFGGSGIFAYDHDGDGTPDYRDLDSDGDGQPDIIEGNDFNLNGIADDNVTLTGLDTDGDGLDNRFDSLNSVTNIKGTSYRMGNAGSLAGDASPGSRCTVQKKVPAQTDRDWRYVGSVLPVQFLQLTAVLQNDEVLLNWSVIALKDVDHFEIEQSTDNINFAKTGVVSQPVKLNEPQNFSFNDNVSNVNRDIIYYRIKVLGKAGEVQYSNIVLIRKQQAKTMISIMPNPARDYVSVVFFAEKDSEITLRLVNDLGKIVLLQSQKVLKGNNTLQLQGLNKYSNGVYSLQMFVNDEVITQKLILAK